MREKLTTSSKLRKNREGFTIIEVVVAASLLAVAMVPILKALTNSYMSSAVIEQKTRSLMYSQTKLNEIRGSSIYNYDASFTSPETSLGNSYFYRVADTSAGSNLRSVTVSVGYDDDGSGGLPANEIMVTLSTLIARRY